MFNISIFRIKVGYEGFWARWLRETETASFVSLAIGRMLMLL
jgi:hypothetical protein